eukprot:m.19189 g.19189  ORF g.19189 m.19189 type:complete len:99 (-) comp7990_c0_seq2:83-379(-)
MNFCTAWIRCMTHNKLTTTTTLFHGSLVSENNPLANFSRLFIQRCYISDTLILPHDVDLFVSGVCCVYAVNHFPLSLSHPLFVVCKQTYEVSGLENAE